MIRSELLLIHLHVFILTSSVSFTRRICSLRSWRSLKVDCAVMEYTRAKPWPFFMYKSLIAVNCSYKNTENEEEEDAMSSVIYYLSFYVPVNTYCPNLLQQEITLVWPALRFSDRYYQVELQDLSSGFHSVH